MLNRILSLVGVLVMLIGVVPAMAQYSGVVIVPANATADDSITIIVNHRETCPRNDAGLGAATTVRLHGGVRINGVNWQNVVSASNGDPTQPLTTFTPSADGTFRKRILPRSYFNVPQGTVIEALNFVLNGGPDNDPWIRQGKVCDANGNAAPGGAGDFFFSFPLAPSNGRFAVLNELPTSDTTLLINGTVRFRAFIRDTTGQAIDSVQLLRNGTVVATNTNGIGDFTVGIGADTGRFSYSFRVFGANGVTRTSVARSIHIVEQILVPRLYVNITTPGTSSLPVLTPVRFEIDAQDSSGLAIENVEIYENGVLATILTAAPYIWNDTTARIPGTWTYHAVINGANGASRQSADVVLTTTGDFASLGSGVWISPANATAEQAVTIVVNPNLTCPTNANNTNSSLSRSNQVRLHAGVNGFQNTVNAFGPSIGQTLFTRNSDGYWTKTITPRSYFGLAPNVQVASLNFVLNGGDDANPWAREGKVCGSGGAAANGDAGNFNFEMTPSLPAPQLSVSIQVPSTDTTVRTGATVIVRAAASDATGRPIDSVVYFVGSNRVGALTSAPYTLTFEGTPAGVYPFTAVAYGFGGASATSTVRTLTVEDAPAVPRIAVAIASPATGTFARDEALTITVAASDTSNGTIDSVRLFEGNTLIGVDRTAPFEFAYTTDFLNSSASLTARAFVGTVSAVSAPVVITTEDTNLVSLGSGVYYMPSRPTADQDLTFIVDASATCPNGPNNSLAGSNQVRIHSGVNGFQNAVNAFGATMSSTTFTRNAQGFWVKTIRPRTYYGLAGATLVNEINFVLNGGPDNDPWSREGKVCGTLADFRLLLSPSTAPADLAVSLSRPTADTSIFNGQQLTVVANAVDRNGYAIDSVVFFANNERVGASVTAPYTAVVTATQPGAVALTARVFGLNGASAVSTARNVTVMPGTNDILVAITSPAQDVTGQLPSSRFTISVDASIAGGGAVDSVYLFEGTRLIGVDRTAPYEFDVLSTLYPRNMMFTARAFSGQLFNNSTSRFVDIDRTLYGSLGSGVYYLPANPTADSEVAIIMDATQTCPTSTANANSSLAGSGGMVRLHAGVTIGGNGFQNVVSAGPGASQASTRLPQTEDGYFVKVLVPRTYFGLAPNAQPTAINFVFNGGPDANPWSREGKRCGTNGQPLPGGEGDFGLPLSPSLPAPMIAVAIARPGVDTTIAINERVAIVATASDSTGRAIDSVVFRVDGQNPFTATSAPYAVEFTAGNTADTVVITADAYGAEGATRRATRVIRIATPPPAPAIAVAFASPANGTLVAPGSRTTLEVTASDSNNAPIDSVVLFRDNQIFDIARTAPYNFEVVNSWLPGTATYTARAYVGAFSRAATVTLATDMSNMRSLTSGVYVIPANPTADDSILFVVDPSMTCPTVAANPGSSLAGSNQVRIHAGIRVGINGPRFTNTVNAFDATMPLTNFTLLDEERVWIKGIRPRSYFNRPASDSIYEVNFVLNGGPDNNPWSREGKVCGNNGQAAPGGAGDFVLPLTVPLTDPRLSASIMLPTQDTSVAAGSVVTVHVEAMDTTGQAIRRVVLLANGRAVDSIATAPYHFSYTASTANETVALTALVRGLRGFSALSAARNITTTGGFTIPRLAVAITSPATTLRTGSNTEVIIDIAASDSTNQDIRFVRLWADGQPVANDTTAPYQFTYRTSLLPDSVVFTAQVIGQGDINRVSAPVSVVSAPTSFASLGSGVYVIPANPSADDSLVVVVDPTMTCPTTAANAAGSLAGSNQVRLHAGIQIGLSGQGFSNTISASPGATQAITRFERSTDGLWFKGLRPRNYFSRATTDSIYAMNFVLNGGPDNSPWDREGKVCGDNGQPAPGAAGDFRLPLFVPETPARLSASIVMPTQDTTVQVGAELTVEVSAMDSSGQSVRRVVLLANGQAIDSVATAPYRFRYVAGDVNGSVVLTAIARGVRSSSVVSAARTLTVQGQVVTPRLGIVLSGITAADTVVAPGSPLSITVNAVDSTGQPIRNVSLAMEGLTFAQVNGGSHTFNFRALGINDTVTLTASAEGLAGATITSTSKVIITNGVVANLGSGVFIYPAAPTADQEIIVTVLANQTCPTDDANAGRSLASSNQVRLHAGIRVGANGPRFTNVVDATTAAAGTNFSRRFAGLPLWEKVLTPRTYFNRPIEDSITEINFVMNGGPAGDPWSREGKVCGTGGQPAAGSAGDFIFPLTQPEPIAPRLSASIVRPSVDTTVAVGALLHLEVMAMDSSNQPVRSVILWADGERIDTITQAPYHFTVRMPAVADTVTFLAQAIGVRGANVISGPRVVITSGALLPPRLSASITMPTADTTVGFNETFAVEAVAMDSSGQDISRVELLVDGQVQSSDATAPYSFTYTSPMMAGSADVAVRVVALNGTTLTSASRRISTTGMSVNLGSGVRIMPAVATADDSITIVVDPRATCPSPSFNANASLVGASIVRIHAGIQLGQNGPGFTNVVNATNNAPTLPLTVFTQQANGTWVKGMRVRQYFNRAASDSIYAINFVLNGGPDNNTFAREGKICNPNGSGGADYRFGLNVPLTPVRLSASFTLPTQDTTVSAGALVPVHVMAMDSSTQAINRVVLWANGVRIDSLAAAPYHFNYRAPGTNGTVTLLAQVIGARGAALISAPRVLTVIGQLEPARLSVRMVRPSVDTTVDFRTRVTFEAGVVDTSGQAIDRVIFRANNTVVATATSAPFTFSWTSPGIPDTVNVTAEAVSITGATLTSAARRVITSGALRAIGSGVFISPANPSADDEISIMVLSNETCPTATANAARSLAASTQVRLHAGVRIGIAGNRFTRVVDASQAAAVTNFTAVRPGVWVKTLTPRQYFALAATDSVYEMNFVMNGGPSNNPWAREGKVCGTNGNEAPGDAGNFNLGLRVDVTPFRVSARIERPSVDTTVDTSFNLAVVVAVTDSASQGISRVVLRNRGVAIDTAFTAPYQFTVRTGRVRDTMQLTAEVFGNQFGRTTTSVRQVIVNGPVQVKGLIAASDIILAPNPVRDVLNIRTLGTELKEIAILSVQGQLLMQKEVSTTSAAIEMQHLPAGAYLVRVTTVQGYGFARVLKQ